MNTRIATYELNGHPIAGWDEHAPDGTAAEIAAQARHNLTDTQAGDVLSVIVLDEDDRGRTVETDRAEIAL